MSEQVRACVICGNNTSALHFLPKIEELKKKWLEFIFGTPPAEYNAALVLCSDHFNHSDFSNFSAFSSGFASRLFLIYTVKTIDHQLTSYDYSAYYNLSRNGSRFQVCNNSNVRDFSQVFLPTVYSIVFIVGFIGNGLVLCVLVKYHKPFNMSDLCLFNLAISDLLFLISLPFWADYAAKSIWAFPEFMCHAVTALYMLGFYGSIFFMILMTVDRYAVIVHTATTLIPKHRSVSASIVLALFVWTLSLGVSLPNIIFSKVNLTKCMVEYSERKVWKSFHYIELNILGFIIPLSVMLFCYSRIIPILMTMQSQKKHKAVRLMVVIVTVFFLFWTPYNIVIFLKLLQELGSMTSRHCYQDLDMAIQWVESIAFCHCCLNPIIYAFVGQKFRNLFLKILKEWFPLCFGQCTTVESKSSERTSSKYSHASMISST